MNKDKLTLINRLKNDIDHLEKMVLRYRAQTIVPDISDEVVMRVRKIYFVALNGLVDNLNYLLDSKRK